MTCLSASGHSQNQSQTKRGEKSDAGNIIIIIKSGSLNMNDKLIGDQSNRPELNVWERLLQLSPSLSKYLQPLVLSISSSKRKVIFETTTASLILEFDLIHGFQEKKLPCLLMLESSVGESDLCHGDLLEVLFFQKVKNILNTHFKA